jgi:hypothetical protein
MVTYLSLVAMIVSGLIGYFHDERAPTPVLVTALAVAAIAWLACNRADTGASRSDRVGPPGTLFALFAIKYTFTTVVVYCHWQHYLSNSSDVLFGYDPERYFFDAYSWSMVNFDFKFLPGNGYIGVVLIYGLLFKVVGWSPMIAAALNVCISFVAMYRLSAVVVSTSAASRSRTTILIPLLAVPDLLWYDCLTGRESLLVSTLVLLFTSCITFGRAPSPFARAQALAWAFVWLCAIALIRTSIALPALCFGLVPVWDSRRRDRARRAFALTTFLTVGLLCGAVLSLALGSQVTLLTVGADQIIGQQIHSDLYYTQASVTRQLATDNVYLHILYTPVRCLFYLVNGLHNLYYDWDTVMNPGSVYLQSIASALTAAWTIALLPVLAVTILKSFGGGTQTRSWRVLTVPFLAVLLPTGLGTEIVHERYRVMALPFLVASLMLPSCHYWPTLKAFYGVYAIGLFLAVALLIYLKATLS